MTDKSNKKPFIPRDKPKSYIILILTALMGCLVGGQLMFGGYFIGIKGLIVVGKILFVSCWLVKATMGIIFVSGLFTDRYKKMEGKDWNQQIW